jgi:curved DNA-binding protein CbpA
MFKAKYSQLRDAGWSRSEAYDMAEQYVLSRVGSDGATDGSHSAGSQRKYGHSNHDNDQSFRRRDARARRFGGLYETEERQPGAFLQEWLQEFRRNTGGPQTYTSFATYGSMYGNHSGADSYTFSGARNQSYNASSQDGWYGQAPHHDPQPSSTYDAAIEGIKPASCLYKIMGVSKTASTEEIKRAHRKLSLKWHPDRAAADQQKEATKKMAQINQARDVLMDKQMRRYYDRTGWMPSNAQAA